MEDTLESPHALFDCAQRERRLKTIIVCMFNLSRNQCAIAWPSFVLVLAAFAGAVGAPMTVASGVLLLLACIAPTAAMLLIWRGPPPPTVAELLYAANTSDNRGPR
jgi:hypothetical protein